MNDPIHVGGAKHRRDAGRRAGVSLIWDRISNPKVGSDGVQPKPDDFRLVVGVGAHF
jgi:hypothetical protein